MTDAVYRQAVQAMSHEDLIEAATRVRDRELRWVHEDADECGSVITLFESPSPLSPS